MNREDFTRFSRQLKIKDWGEAAQNRLYSSTVVIAGSGGLGSPVILYLTAAGVGNLKIIDYDTVELSNLNRQIIHTTSSIDHPKVLSASESAQSIYPAVNIIPVEEKITAQNCNDLIGTADLIIDCLDNFKTRHILNKTAVENSIPLIHGGIEQFQGQVTFIHSPDTPCLTCFLPQKDNPEKPQVVGATAGIIGSIQAQEALKYLTGIGPALKNKLLFFDGLSMEIEKMNLTKNSSCKVCGKL